MEAKKANGVMSYDITELQALYAELTPAERSKALKGALRAEGRKVRKEAINQLRASGLSSNSRLEKGIRSEVYKRTFGFRVTVRTRQQRLRNGTTKAQGFYESRHEAERVRKAQAKGKVAKVTAKPILIWAETGTPERRTKANAPKTKNGKHGWRWVDRDRAAHRTGKLRRYGFISKTEERMRSVVTDDMHDTLTEYVIKTAKKHGCK